MPPTPPRDNTLAKYGLSRAEFNIILATQFNVCAICHQAPNGRWNIDHQHVKGWNKMTPERRKRYVRGILCWTCNRLYAGRGMTVERAEALVIYLKKHTERIESWQRKD